MIELYNLFYRDFGPEGEMITAHIPIYSSGGLVSLSQAVAAELQRQGTAPHPLYPEQAWRTSAVALTNPDMGGKL